MKTKPLRSTRPKPPAPEPLTKPDQYERQTKTKQGLAWLGRHPEAQSAHVLGSHLLGIANLLADPNRPAAERRAQAELVRAAWRAFYDRDSEISVREAKQLALARALDHAFTTPADVLPVDRQGDARALLSLRVALVKTEFIDIDPRLVDGYGNELDTTIARALASWKMRGSKSTKWDDANRLADLLGCGCTSGPHLEEAIKRAKRKGG